MAQTTSSSEIQVVQSPSTNTPQSPSTPQSPNAPDARYKLFNQTNYCVFTAATAAGISFYVAKIDEPSITSAATLPLIAGASGLGFLGSSIGIFLAHGGGNITMVKLFTIVGVTGLFGTVGMAMMHVCLPERPVSIGATVSLLPIVFLGEKFFRLRARFCAFFDRIASAPLLRHMRRA